MGKWNSYEDFATTGKKSLKTVVPPPHERGRGMRKFSRWIVMSMAAAFSPNAPSFELPPSPCEQETS
jgi:hypothetical protein